MMARVKLDTGSHHMTIWDYSSGAVENDALTIFWVVRRSFSESQHSLDYEKSRHFAEKSADFCTLYPIRARNTRLLVWEFHFKSHFEEKEFLPSLVIFSLLRSDKYQNDENCTCFNFSWFFKLLIMSSPLAAIVPYYLQAECATTLPHALANWRKSKHAFTNWHS